MTALLLARSIESVQGRRYRLPALCLATFGWVVQLLGACLVAERSGAAVVVLAIAGALLLATSWRAHGELRFAAVGVASVGVIATAIAALTIGSPAAPLDADWTSRVLGPAGAAIAMGGVAILPWIRPRHVRGLALIQLVAIVGLGVATLPRFDSRALHRAHVRNAAPAIVAPEMAQGGAQAASRHEARHVSASADPLRPSVAAVDSETPVVALRPIEERERVPLSFLWIWALGLGLALTGTFGVGRALHRLGQLDRAVVATRAGDDFVLADGCVLLLDREPNDDEALVLTEVRGASYRTNARARACLVGTGSLDEERERARDRIATLALGAVLTTATAWLPLLILRLEGWAITSPW